ncbi:PIN domain-containing protein [Polaromonas sp.]|nr:PIN domain-containing protein [Candidatus Saccharibacteria bacterium]
MNSLDTNIVLRYLLNDIPEQSLKSKLLITGSESYVTDVIAVEIIFVLERVVTMERADIVTLFKSFLSLPNLVYNDYFLDQVIDLYGAKKKLSIVDCYAATEAKVYGNSLITFDKELVKQGGDHVREPSSSASIQ